MNVYWRILIGVGANLLVLVVALVVLGGADSSDAPATAPASTTELASAAAPPPATAEPIPPAAPGAEDIARQALAVAYTWYPGTDTTPNDAFERARVWFTAALAQKFSVDARTERWPNAQWGTWAAEGSIVIADVRVDCSGCPPDTDTEVHRVVTIQQTAVTGEHTMPVDPALVVWVTVTKQGHRWLVDTIHY